MDSRREELYAEANRQGEAGRIGGETALRSDEVKKGPARVAHRSLFYAMGYTAEELDRPLIGVVNSQNEIVPGHFRLDDIARAVKDGIRSAGGTPIEFPSIAIDDGIAMGHEGMRYPLPSRELIADSIEAMAIGHQFDALVLITNCDKITPGMLMAAARLDIPAIIMSGGPMLPGSVNGTEGRRGEGVRDDRQVSRRGRVRG